jgi:hypothetical protein
MFDGHNQIAASRNIMAWIASKRIHYLRNIRITNFNSNFHECEFISWHRVNVVTINQASDFGERAVVNYRLPPETLKFILSRCPHFSNLQLFNYDQFTASVVTSLTFDRLEHLQILTIHNCGNSLTKEIITCISTFCKHLRVLEFTETVSEHQECPVCLGTLLHDGIFEIERLHLTRKVQLSSSIPLLIERHTKLIHLHLQIATHDTSCNLMKMSFPDCIRLVSCEVKWFNSNDLSVRYIAFNDDDPLGGFHLSGTWEVHSWLEKFFTIHNKFRYVILDSLTELTDEILQTISAMCLSVTRLQIETCGYQYTRKVIARILCMPKLSILIIGRDDNCIFAVNCMVIARISNIVDCEVNIFYFKDALNHFNLPVCVRFPVGRLSGLDKTYLQLRAHGSQCSKHQRFGEDYSIQSIQYTDQHSFRMNHAEIRTNMKRNWKR